MDVLQQAKAENAAYLVKKKDAERREREKQFMEQRKLEIKTRTLKRSDDGPLGAQSDGRPFGEGTGSNSPGPDSADSIPGRRSRGDNPLDDIISAIRTGKAFGAGDDILDGGGRNGKRGASTKPFPSTLLEGMALKTSTSNILDGFSEGANSEPLLALTSSKLHTIRLNQTKNIRAALKKMTGGTGAATPGSRGMSMDNLLKVDADLAASAPADLSKEPTTPTARFGLGSLRAQ